MSLPTNVKRVLDSILGHAGFLDQNKSKHLSIKIHKEANNLACGIEQVQRLFRVIY